LIGLIVHTRQLNDLIRAIPVERQAAAGVDNLSFFVLPAAENQSAIFRTFIVIETRDVPCLLHCGA
jgi:hypothetical protein